MTNSRKILKSDTGKFGKIVADDKHFEKTMWGVILFVDYSGSVIFVDNDNISYKFTADKITSFEEQEFKPTTNA
jgi:hypothetical protein